jgi:formylglycine-generating enzyme required for sulfatase activity
MSVREFGLYLGVSERMVAKWEAGGRNMKPRPVNQSALDVALDRAAPHVHSRFRDLTATSAHDLLSSKGAPASVWVATGLVRHPEDSKLMALVPAGLAPLGIQEMPTWLAGFFIDVFPVTVAEYAVFRDATGRDAPPGWLDGQPPPDRWDHPVVGVSCCATSGVIM